MYYNREGTFIRTSQQAGYYFKFQIGNNFLHFGLLLPVTSYVLVAFMSNQQAEQAGTNICVSPMATSLQK